MKKVIIKSLHRISIFILSANMDVLLKKNEYENKPYTREGITIHDDHVTSILHRDIQKVAIQMFEVKNNMCPELKSLFHQIPSRTRSKALFTKVNTP